MQVHAVAWSEMLRRLTMTHPDCPVTVWCNEDTPLIWGELLQDIAAVGIEVPLRARTWSSSRSWTPPATTGCRNTCARSRPRPRRSAGAWSPRSWALRVDDQIEEVVSIARLDRGFHGRTLGGL
jgi:hypothetical protein